MSRARVSVIIIFYQAEAFLAEAIGSVVRQSFSDWELLLVDDGSTDRGPGIAAAAVADWPDRARLLHHPERRNRGMSASRNLGLAAASGEFVAFLDADDVWLPEKLSEQIEVLEREPDAALVYGRTRIWRSWGPGNPAPDSDFFYDLGVTPDRLYRPPRLFNVLIRNRHQTPTTCNAILRRSLIDRVGGFEDSFRGMFEDQVFFAKALLTSSAFVDGREWALYRQHASSHSAVIAGTAEESEARARFLSRVAAHLREHPDVPLPARIALAKVLWAVRLERLRERLRKASVLGRPV